MNPLPFAELALAVGVVAGLRTLTAPAIVSWAARIRWLDLDDSWAQFLGDAAAPWVLSVLAFGELIGDQFARMPSRKTPVVFAARIASGAFCGVALAAGVGNEFGLGAVCGAMGAIVGTLAGYAVRTGLVRALRVPDWFIAIPEDLVAVVGGFVLVAYALQ